MSSKERFLYIAILFLGVYYLLNMYFSNKEKSTIEYNNEISKIAKKNELLFSRIVGILDSNTLVSQNSDMAKIMVEYYDNTIDDNVQLLKHLRQGFTE